MQGPQHQVDRKVNLGVTPDHIIRNKPMSLSVLLNTYIYIYIYTPPYTSKTSNAFKSMETGCGRRRLRIGLEGVEIDGRTALLTGL